MNAKRLEAGQVIDGFSLEGPLDPGGMASFWRVTRPGTDMQMVMKIPLMRRGEDPITIVGFEVEQMILARLSGPHVPRFVAAGDFERPYIVMEFVAGRSVRTFLERTPLDPAEVADIGARIAFALHDLHRQHVIHLDLKPSNVILRDDGEAVLIDYGLSRHDQLPDLMAEEFDDPIGTGPYVSPEQVLRDRGDPRSDLFALGVILYFLSTGERPFGEPVRAGEWRRRLWRDPLPPRRRNEKIPPWLQEIILRCLEIDPANRYQTAAQLAFDLQHPEQVALTERATRLERDGRMAVFMRWMRAPKRAPRRRTLSGLLAGAPIVMAAIDLAPEASGLREALATAVERVLATAPGARLACVNVLKAPQMVIDTQVDAHGRSMHLQRLVALKHWARALAVADARVTYHVIEASDPAAAIIDYARNTQIDHIVMGARGSSSMRRLLGSVSAKVVAEAPCTVTVVRLPAGEIPQGGAMS
jgi:nucleotide-binding universal stress UspA family protein